MHLHRVLPSQIDCQLVVDENPDIVATGEAEVLPPLDRKDAWLSLVKLKLLVHALVAPPCTSAGSSSGKYMVLSNVKTLPFGSTTR